MTIPLTHAQKGKEIPIPYAGRTNHHVERTHHAEYSGLKEALSEKFNDSIYTYLWKTSTSDWLLFEKEYRTKSPEGFVGQRLYLKLDTLSSQWVNDEKDILEYFGTSGDEQMVNYKTWDPVGSAWLDVYYVHNYTPGKSDEFYEKYWNAATRKFYYGYHVQNQYDVSGKDTVEIDQSWDTTTNNWVNSTKYSHTWLWQSLAYDLNMTWDTASMSWVNYTRTDYTYDGNNFLVQSLGFSWNGSNWIQNTRSSYTNNAAGLPLESILEYYNGSSWDTNSRSQFTYTADGLLLNQLNQGYNTGTHQWINSNEYVNTYFANGMYQTKASSKWNTIDNVWLTFSYNLYDSLGNGLENFYKNYNYSTFQFTSGVHYINLYDEHQRFLEETMQKLDTASGGWIDYERIIDSYEDDVSNVYVQELGTIWTGSDWVNEYKDVFYWSYPNGTGNLTNCSVRCFYENPIPRGAAIDCPFLEPDKTYRFELFSMEGKKVYETPVSGSASLIINRPVAAGNYFLRISENGRTVYRDKVVIVD